MSDQETILSLINKTSFFSIFSDAEKEYLSTLNNQIISSKASDVIVKQGNLDTELFILIKGQVKIFKNERPNIILAHLKPGNVFGEISYLKKTPRTANAVSTKDSIFLKISGKTFDKMSAEIQNKFQQRFLDIFIERLDDLNKRYIRDAISPVHTATERR
ncbi:MAG TPA: cyclic nucleotide-binding domain-containing protein [Candidatus Lambdaproteobacteria bacterium]|nr:cyclic nucleotide-binding domain-containing protein [Candidatus Lambdaproteobacteria bacterium]